MNVKYWGPAGWKYLHTVTFNYPEEIDETDPDHVDLPRRMQDLFENLQFTLPCKYCRASFQQFFKELPIEPFLGGRKALTLWLYLMHNKVNRKLRRQENALLRKKVKELKQECKEKTVTRKEYTRRLNKLQKEILYTQPDPSYEEVCERYEAHRAGCHADANKIKSCRL
jgi:hypothetical protein